MMCRLQPLRLLGLAALAALAPATARHAAAQIVAPTFPQPVVPTFTTAYPGVPYWGPTQVNPGIGNFYYGHAYNPGVVANWYSPYEGFGFGPYAGFGGFGAGWGVGLGYGAYGGYGYGGYGRGGGAAYTPGGQRYLNAEAMNELQEARVNSQEAFGKALENYKKLNKIDPYYNFQTMARIFDRNDIEPIPTDQLVDESGRVKWPEETPSGPGIDPQRQAINEAVQKVVQETHGPDGRAKVRDVIEARDRIESYAMLALPKLAEEDAETASGFQYFLMSLDRAVANLGRTAGPGRIDIRPEGSPRTGGDVLKETILDRSRRADDPAGRDAAPADRPNTIDVRPEGSPATGGDVLKGTTLDRTRRANDPAGRDAAPPPDRREGAAGTGGDVLFKDKDKDGRD